MPKLAVYGALCAAVILVCAVFVPKVSAHGDGMTISETVNGMVVDIDVDSSAIESGYPNHFSLNLFRNDERTQKIPFDKAWVRFIQVDDSKNGLTIFSGYLTKGLFGNTGLSVTLPRSGEYKLLVRYYDEKDDDIVEATIPFTVVRGFDEQAFQISIEFWVGIAIGMVLIMVGFVPFAYKLGLSHGRRKI